jgi:general secretion pathway protein G
MSSQFIARVRRGFTLIEILIVVVILGILAAIVIPQFTDASFEASVSSLQTQLQTVRSQIELYNVQNPATPYDAAGFGDDGAGAQEGNIANFWNALVQGDYLQTAPRNPLQNGSSTVAAAAAGGVGWVWDDFGSAWALNLYAVDETGGSCDLDNDSVND